MSDIKFYDSVSQPKGDFFHRQWAKSNIILNGDVISSEIESLEIETPDDMKLDSVPPLGEEHSFTVELEEKESDRLRKMLWLDRIDWFAHQMNTVWKDKFFEK